MLAKVLLVLEITIPIFAMLGLGKLLQLRGILTPDVRRATNAIISNFSLPAIIFLAIAQASFYELLNPVVIFGSIAPILVMLVIYLPLASIMRVESSQRPAFIYGPFWSNMAYMGIPLAYSAFGEAGKLNAAIINAFYMPVCVIGGTVLIYLQKPEAGSMKRRLIDATFNPIPLSAFAGILCALVADSFGLRGIDNQLLTSTGNVLIAFLKLLGNMGLPLALLAIGAELKVIGHQRLTLSLACAGKLILLPLSSLLLIRLVFPEASPVDAGSCVLVLATPTAVASHIISTKAGVAPEFAASMVIRTTGLSILTIPVWTYFLI